MSSLDVSKERISIQSEYVRRGKRKAASSFRADRSFRAKSCPDTEKYSILSVCSLPFARRLHLLGAALKLQHPSIRSTRSTFQQIAGASSRADRSSRAKSRPDTEKDSEYTSMFVRKKRPLHAAFASARHGAETSASFDQKHAINFPTKSRRFVPR